MGSMVSTQVCRIICKSMVGTHHAIFLDHVFELQMAANILNELDMYVFIQILASFTWNTDMAAITSDKGFDDREAYMVALNSRGNMRLLNGEVNGWVSCMLWT